MYHCLYDNCYDDIMIYLELYKNIFDIICTMCGTTVPRLSVTLQRNQ